MWKKLCPQLSAAEGITSESYTLSNGSTIRNKKTGQKNPSTTSWKEDWRNFENSIDETPTH